jgi:hypothetical protein
MDVVMTWTLRDHVIVTSHPTSSPAGKGAAYELYGLRLIKSRPTTEFAMSPSVNRSRIVPVLGHFFFKSTDDVLGRLKVSKTPKAAFHFDPPTSKDIFFGFRLPFAISECSM